MKPHSRLTALVMGASLFTSLSVASAEPSHSTQASASKASKSPKKHTPRQVFNGWAVPESKLRVQPVKRPSGKIEISSLNEPGAHVSVNIYNPDGSYNEEALDQLNRCGAAGHRDGEVDRPAHLGVVARLRSLQNRSRSSRVP